MAKPDYTPEQQEMMNRIGSLLVTTAQDIDRKISEMLPELNRQAEVLAQRGEDFHGVLVGELTKWRNFLASHVARIVQHDQNEETSLAGPAQQNLQRWDNFIADIEKAGRAFKAGEHRATYDTQMEKLKLEKELMDKLRENRS